MTRSPRAFRFSSLSAVGVCVISKILAYAMAPSAVMPAKYRSMSAGVTSSLATATTSRAGWETVQCTGMSGPYHRERNATTIKAAQGLQKPPRASDPHQQRRHDAHDDAAETEAEEGAEGDQGALEMVPAIVAEFMPLQATRKERGPGHVAGGLGAAMHDHEMDHVPDGAENGGDAQQPERREHEPDGDVGIFDQGLSSAPPATAGRGSVGPGDSRGQAAARGL